MKRATDGKQLNEAYTKVYENMMGGVPMTIVTTDEHQPECGGCGMCGDCQSHAREDRPDSSEMEMAQSDIHKALEYSQKLSEILPTIPALEGWTASKITKAADYLSSVYHWLDYESSKGAPCGHDHGENMYNMGAEDGE